MHKQAVGAVAGVVLSLALVAAPALAQNFQDGSTETIWPGAFRLTGSPVHLFGPGGGPDRDGGAFRLGYGMTDSLDVEAKTGFFDGFTLVGGDAHYRLLDGPTSLSVRAGGHQALMRDVPDSTALDLSAQVGRRVGPRLELYAGPAFSRESVNGVRDSGFSRWYVVPGVRWGFAERADLLVEAGVGLNDDSPSYVTAGLAVHVPVTGGARGRRH
jgi:hypothetical protein